MLTFLTILIVPGALAAMPLTAHLDLVPNHALPGIPVVFVVTVTNSGAQPVELYEYARLTATDAGGNTFGVRWGGRNDGGLLTTSRVGNNSSHVTMIPSGGKATFYMPVGVELMENSAFYDSRLCVPGTYDLQLVVGQADNVKTNSARLTVEQPQGSDLAFLKAAAAASGDDGLNLATWMNTGAPLLAKYQDSTYYQLLAFYRFPSEEPKDIIAVVKQALAAGVSGPIADEFRGQVAYSLEAEARAAANSGDFQTAQAALDEAATFLKAMIDLAATDYTREKALDLRAELQGTAAEVATKRSHQTVKPDQPVKPTVQCRESDSRIRFGYVAKNDSERIKVGPQNHFDPEPSDRGQPVDFSPGTHKKAISVGFLPGERSLTWVLTGSSATFSLDGPGTLKLCDEGDN